MWPVGCPGFPQWITCPTLKRTALEVGYVGATAPCLFRRCPGRKLVTGPLDPSAMGPFSRGCALAGCVGSACFVARGLEGACHAARTR